MLLSQFPATQIRWKDHVDTPAVVVDLDIVERNILRGAEFSAGAGVDFRPHIKTHKIPALAHAQLEAGAKGITAQKISEAEVMADAGIDNILISYNILGEKKLERLRNLSKRVRLQTVADNATVVQGLADAFAGAEAPLPVLVEIDGMLRRCGVQSAEQALALAQQIDAAPGLRFLGFMVYPAPNQWQAAQSFLADCKTLAAAHGLKPQVLSSGGSPDMVRLVIDANVTEYRAGSYIYNDRSLVAAGRVQMSDCALSVFTTVVSRPTSTRAIVDAGSKSLSSDLFGLEGFGMIAARPDADIFALSEEHGHIEFSDAPPKVGARLSIIPNHACVVSNLVDSVQFVRGDHWVCEHPVAARGTTQ